MTLVGQKYGLHTSLTFVHVTQSRTTPVFCNHPFLIGIPTGRLEVVSEEDLAVLARDHLTNWESLRPFLGLIRQQEAEIRNSYPKDYGRQKLECLEVWKEMKGDGATYDALIRAAEKAKDQLLADRVRTMLVAKASST